VLHNKERCVLTHPNQVSGYYIPYLSWFTTPVFTYNSVVCPISGIGINVSACICSVDTIGFLVVLGFLEDPFLYLSYTSHS
jgi:hypothetical protein